MVRLRVPPFATSTIVAAVEKKTRHSVDMYSPKGSRHIILWWKDKYSTMAFSGDRLPTNPSRHFVESRRVHLSTSKRCIHNQWYVVRFARDKRSLSPVEEEMRGEIP